MSIHLRTQRLHYDQVWRHEVRTDPLDLRDHVDLTGRTILTTSTIATLPITTPSVVREAFSLSTARAHEASVCFPQSIMRLSLPHRSTWLVDDRSDVLGYNLQVGPPDKLLEMRHFRAISKKVASFRPLPQRRELAVIDKHVGSAGRVRAIFQIVVPAVQ